MTRTVECGRYLLLAALIALFGRGAVATAADLPNVHVYPALERQAIAHMAGSPYRMKVSETCSNSSTVYVIAYRDGVPGTRWFRFDVRYTGGRVDLVLPPTQVR